MPAVADARRHDAGRARQRRPREARRGRPAAVPGARVLPWSARALGLHRPGLLGTRPSHLRARPDRQALRAAARHLRVRRPRLRALHLSSLRHLYARAYTDDVGGARASSGTSREARSKQQPGRSKRLQPLDLLLEEPTEVVQPADIDLVTGALNPERLGRATPTRLHSA